MRFLKINGELVNRYMVARATFNDGKLTLNLHGAGQHEYTGPDAEAAWDALQEDLDHPEPPKQEPAAAAVTE